MKTVRAAIKTSDFRVWCEHCSIRIAPHEEKIDADGNTYHQRCFSKRSPAGSAARAPAAQPADVPGGEK